MTGQRLRRALVQGTAAAVLWGLVAAALSRLLMRAAVLVTGGDPGFSVVGTAGIAVAYVVVLLPGAIALAYSAHRWPWAVFGAGAVLLATQAVNIGLQDLAAAPGLSTGRWALLGLVLAAMAAVHAGHAVLVARWARRAAPRPVVPEEVFAAPVPR